MNEAMQLSLLRERFYRRERRSVPAAREFVRTAVTDWGFGTRLDDVLLCVSELATNALLHGVPPGRGYVVRLLLREGGTGLRVEVHDSGSGDGRRPVVREPEGESGRGLLLVAAVADPRVADMASGRGTAELVYDAAAAERLRGARRWITARLRGQGVEVVDAPPEELAPALADAYLALKAAGRL